MGSCYHENMFHMGTRSMKVGHMTLRWGRRILISSTTINRKSCSDYWCLRARCGGRWEILHVEKSLQFSRPRMTCLSTPNSCSFSCISYHVSCHSSPSASHLRPTECLFSYMPDLLSFVNELWSWSTRTYMSKRERENSTCTWRALQFTTCWLIHVDSSLKVFFSSFFWES